LPFVRKDSSARPFSVVALGLVMGTGLLSWGVIGCQQAPSADVVATVNGKQIMAADVDRFYKESLGDSAQSLSKEEIGIQRLIFLGKLIDDEILQQRAERLKLVATDEEVDAKITEMKALSTQEEFNKQLKERNVTLEDVRRDIRRAISKNKLINKDIESKVNITDEEIKDYFAQHKTEFNLIEPEYHLAQILVSNDASAQVANLQGNKANNDAEARKKIQMLRGRLDSGESFSSVAANFSEDPATSATGGDLGFILESPFRQAYPEVFTAVNKLKANQFTDPMPIVKGEGPGRKTVGYGIYELLEKRPAGQGDLTDPRVQQRIRLLLHNNHVQLLQNAYYEMLRDDAKIHNYLAEQILRDGAR
jgi:peptidyl-prolyl cis-trans isomerase SurA